MIILSFNSLRNLNVSLQVGDGVYARGTIEQVGAEDLQASSISNYNNLSTGSNHYVGILRRINDIGNNQYDLHVDNNVDGANYVPGDLDFIMFSTEKAEIFAVSSEIIINSN